MVSSQQSNWFLSKMGIFDLGLGAAILLDDIPFCFFFFSLRDQQCGHLLRDTWHSITVSIATDLSLQISARDERKKNKIAAVRMRRKVLLHIACEMDAGHSVIL